MLARMREDFNMTLLGKEMLPSSSTKDLGVVIDANLNFNEHVTDIILLRWLYWLLKNQF